MDRPDKHAVPVSGHHDRKPDIGFRKTEEDGIDIVVPKDGQDVRKWGKTRFVFSQHAGEGTDDERKWEHHVQASEKGPKRFRAFIEHEHPNKHELQTYSLEYTDKGQFDQSDPDLVQKLPAVVYQAMLGMSVALRDIRDKTLQQLEEAVFVEQSDEVVIEKTESLDWKHDEWIYTISVSDEAELESVWEMGFEEADKPATAYRAFARNVELDETYTLFARDDGEYIACTPDLPGILPEAVYSGLFGLAEGAKLAKELTVQAYRSGELDAGDPEASHANRILNDRQKSAEIER